MTARPVGIIANPASGKDIRRLVAHASVFDNNEKMNILRRVMLGAAAAGATDFLSMPEPNRMAETAADSVKCVTLAPVESPRTASALDTTRAASAMREAGCAVVITLGGDGTNRATVKGWLDAPLVAISTGTNNVFPAMLEGTVAGMAAGLVAAGMLPLDDVARQAKRIRIEIEDEADDLALIDAVLMTSSFTGSRAIWQPEMLRTIVLTRAEPAAVGLSALGGLLQPLSDSEDGGLLVEPGDGGLVLRAPLAPGMMVPVPIKDAVRLRFDETVTVTGPGTLAFDGERERTLKPGQRATMRVLCDGPRVLDVALAMRLAACRGLFRDEVNDGD